MKHSPKSTTHWSCGKQDKCCGCYPHDCEIELKNRAYESFKDSSDPDERMAYWINQLSPHNVWKAVIELKAMREEASKSV